MSKRKKKSNVVQQIGKKLEKRICCTTKKQHKKKVKKCCTTLDFFLNVGQHTKDGHKNSNQNFWRIMIKSKVKCLGIQCSCNSWRTQ